jgi:hypothetical protein
MVRRGRGALAERLIREGVSIAEQTDSTDLRASALVWAADVRRQAGRPTEAEPFERRALRLFERRGATAQSATVADRLRPGPDRAAPSTQPTAPPMEPDPAPIAEDAGPTADATAAPVPAGPDGGATRLADEMMAMFSDPDPSQPATETSAEVPTTYQSGDSQPVARQPLAVDLPPTSEQLEAPERPSAEIDPADELLQDPTVSAEEESKRRWFNR